MALLLSLLPSSWGREVASFSFGWKHRAGLHANARPDDPPPPHPHPSLTPAESLPSYDDSSWANVTLPHDALIASAPSSKACRQGCSGQSFLPRHLLWYRKPFKLPAEWAESAVWLDFEGSFRGTRVWVNGVHAASHSCGYTPFRLRLDNLSAISWGEINQIAILVDPDNGRGGGVDRGSGWWYEGGGLYREVWMVRAPRLHFAQDGLFAASSLPLHSLPSPKGRVGGALLRASAELHNAGSNAAGACISFSLLSPQGERVGRATSPHLSLSAGASITSSAEIKLEGALLWTLSSPTLYTLFASLHAEGTCAEGTEVDSVSTSHGFRSLRHDPTRGFFLNEEHFKVGAAH